MPFWMVFGDLLIFLSLSKGCVEMSSKSWQEETDSCCCLAFEDGRKEILSSWQKARSESHQATKALSNRYTSFNFANAKRSLFSGEVVFATQYVLLVHWDVLHMMILRLLKNSSSCSFSTCSE